MDLFELKQNAFNVGENLKKVVNKIAETAVSPAEDAVEKLKVLKEHKNDLQLRFDTLNEQIKTTEAEQKKALKKVKDNVKPENQKTHAYAQLIRNTMAKMPVDNGIYETLGDDDTTHGGKFLPKTVSTNIITAPVEKNPLRDISTVTQIPNLEIPRLDFTLDDDSFIKDTETAKEIAAKGQTVTFGRNKFKVYVGISETVLMGSDADLSAYINQGLRNGIVAKERSVAFNANPTKDNEKHMSFYDPSVNIKKITGSSTYETIMNTIADLPEAYRDNATVVMSFKDYLSMIKELSNGSNTLYGVQPSMVIGKPVVFEDAAVKPIVGQFSYSQYNYDLGIKYAEQTDELKGLEYFVVTAWMDHQIKLSNAFRIADITTTGTTQGSK